MELTVRLFGPEAQAAGATELRVELDAAPVTGAALKQRLIEFNDALAPHVARCRLAVNHEFVADDALIEAGDEVALIGQVSGG